jgi:hypothetical protein
VKSSNIATDAAVVCETGTSYQKEVTANCLCNVRWKKVERRNERKNNRKRRDVKEGRKEGRKDIPSISVNG